jgi:hypothetical protein
MDTSTPETEPKTSAERVKELETSAEIVKEPYVESKIPSQPQSQPLQPDTTQPRPPKREALEFLQVHGLMLYFIALIFLALWFFFDVWSKNMRFMQWMGIQPPALNEPILRTIGFTMVGGFLGSVLYQIRLLFQYYLKSETYDYRWMGKYISAPWESAIMAIIVLALIRGGVALFGGSQGTDVNDTNNFAAFGVGSLVGFGMRDVVGWIGGLVRTTFKATDGGQTPST